MLVELVNCVKSGIKCQKTFNTQHCSQNFQLSLAAVIPSNGMKLGIDLCDYHYILAGLCHYYSLREQCALKTMDTLAGDT